MLQRLKLIVIEGDKSETIEFNSYKEIEDYASDKLGNIPTSIEEKPSSQSPTAKPQRKKKFLVNKLGEIIRSNEPTPGR